MARESHLQETHGCSMKSILMVEDGKTFLLASARALVRAGYDVVTARDGEEALRIAAQKIPDLILLDMLLPKLGGEEVRFKTGPSDRKGTSNRIELFVPKERTQIEEGGCNRLF